MSCEKTGVLPREFLQTGGISLLQTPHTHGNLVFSAPDSSDLEIVLQHGRLYQESSETTAVTGTLTVR